MNDPLIEIAKGYVGKEYLSLTKVNEAIVKELFYLNYLYLNDKLIICLDDRQKKD